MGKFRIIPASKGYPGLTALNIGNGREIVSVGTGANVERQIMEKSNVAKG
jgi:hypothetical protein